MGTCMACVLVYSCSVAYHSHMSRCRCEKEYHTCLNCDVLGVVIGLYLTAISPLVHGYRCNNVLVVVVFVVAFMIVVLFVGFECRAPMSLRQLEARTSAAMSVC